MATATDLARQLEERRAEVRARKATIRAHRAALRREAQALEEIERRCAEYGIRFIHKGDSGEGRTHGQDEDAPAIAGEHTAGVAGE